MNTVVINKPVQGFVLSIGMILALLCNFAFSQTVDDPVGDIPAGDPTYMDMKKVKLSQSKDIILIDFYPNDVIPKGNQGGISTETIFEVYLDVDHDSTTGVRLEDIGYDYKLYLDLNQWDGESWLIDGNLYWNFDDKGNPQSQESRGRFFVHSSYLISTRFRWMFSLISLKWTQVDWIAHTFYGNHLTDQVPDTGHATLAIDCAIITNVDTTSGEYVLFVYPDFFQEEMAKYEVLKAVDEGAHIESQVCGTEFPDIQRIEYNPCLQNIAWSGNPVLIGPSMWSVEPAWFIFFHELGHNFTLASVRFNQLYPGLGYVSVGGDYWNFGTNFSEAWASMVGLYAMRELFTDEQTFHLGDECKTSLESVFNQRKTSLISYEENPDFSMLTPDMIDGIFLTLADSFGYEIIPRFFKVLQPADASWDVLNDIDPDSDYDWAKTLSMTVTCCAFSVAAGVDLRTQFRDQWDFPIDDSLYEEVKPEIEAMMTGVDENLASLDGLRFKLFPNYPNPFNTSTIVSYQLDKSSPVKIKIYDLLGQQVIVIDEGIKAVGYHSLVLDASNIASGVYIYTLETNMGVRSKKCVLLR